MRERGEEGKIWQWRRCAGAGFGHGGGPALETSGIVLDDLRGSWIKAESAALAFNYKLNHGPTSSCVNSSTVNPIIFKSFKVDLTAFWHRLVTKCVK